MPIISVEIMKTIDQGEIQKSLIISFVVTKINEKTNVTFITLNYHILAISHTILKTNFRNFAKGLVKKKINIKLVFNSFKIKNYFSYKHPTPDDLKFFLAYRFPCASL